MKNKRGYAIVALHQPKFPENIACALRAAGCYSASQVVVSGNRFTTLEKAQTDTQKRYRHLPLLNVKSLRDALPYHCTPVAVDLVPDSKSLVNFTHPERAFYVFGPEDGTLDNETLDWCKHRIAIPTAYCMNLAATVNVVLYDRLAKQLRR
ncbi:MAG: RNA methyltransferase [Casimicrobium sp.]